MEKFLSFIIGLPFVIIGLLFGFVPIFCHGILLYVLIKAYLQGQWFVGTSLLILFVYYLGSNTRNAEQAQEIEQLKKRIDQASASLGAHPLVDVDAAHRPGPN